MLSDQRKLGRFGHLRLGAGSGWPGSVRGIPARVGPMPYSWASSWT